MMGQHAQLVKMDLPTLPLIVKNVLQKDALYVILLTYRSALNAQVG